MSKNPTSDHPDWPSDSQELTSLLQKAQTIMEKHNINNWNAENVLRFTTAKDTPVDQE